MTRAFCEMFRAFWNVHNSLKKMSGVRERASGLYALCPIVVAPTRPLHDAGLWLPVLVFQFQHACRTMSRLETATNR